MARMCSGRLYRLNCGDTHLRDRGKGTVAGAGQELGVRTPEQGFRAGNTDLRARSPTRTDDGRAGTFHCGVLRAAAPGSLARSLDVIIKH